MTPTILPTLDYELYGDGSGDIFENLVNPTADLLRHLEPTTFRLTIFVEIVEIIRLREQWNNGNPMAYDRDPIQAITEQLRQAYRKGHDIQLHIHPQWFDAIWTDNRWQVDNSRWQLGSFISQDGKTDIRGLIRWAKNELEQLVRSFDPTYECIALRAGGYNAMPCAEILEAMRQTGLRIDSSVVPGARADNAFDHYDYTAAPTDGQGWWHVSDDIDIPHPTPTDIIELPVTAFSMPGWKKYLSIDRLRSFLKNRNSAIKKVAQKQPATEPKQKRSLLALLTQPQTVTWDFCLLSASQHRKFFQRVTDKKRQAIVLIGHSKGYTSPEGIKLINSLAQERQLRTLTFRRWLDIHQPLTNNLK